MDGVDYTLQKQQRAEDSARVKQAREGLRLIKQEARVHRAEQRLARETEQVTLRESGQKRSFLTGRIVPVRASRRARAYNRSAPSEVN